MAALRQQPHSAPCALQVPEIVRCVWRSVLSITEVSARLSLNRALLKLTCTYPEDVVMTLLRCCPSCDR